MRKVKVRPYQNKQRPYLKYAVGFREAGKRSRKFFETKEAAESFAAFKNAEIKTNGIEAAEFPTKLRIMAQECSDVLSPFGKTIRDATVHYLAHLKASEKSCTAGQLVKELLKAKEADGVGERHLRDLRNRLGYFADQFDGKLVAEITSAEIDAWLRSLDVAGRTRNHYRANILQAFNFAERHGYTTGNPVEGAAKAKVIGGRPGILTVEQTSALLVNAEPEILPYIAIGLFAGLRRAELERLDWSEIDFESGLIEVKAEKSKTAMRRLVTLQPNLRQWLLPLQKLKGLVTPSPERFRQLFPHVRTAAAIREWPENALRHSFASYHLAAFKNAAATALELGHHDSRVTFAHYRELVKPKNAARYWNITPATREKVVPMVARA
jgi:integrase